MIVRLILTVILAVAAYVAEVALSVVQTLTMGEVAGHQFENTNEG
jgi:hypothetical protein